jgi:hypothetical protein
MEYAPLPVAFPADGRLDLFRRRPIRPVRVKAAIACGRRMASGGQRHSARFILPERQSKTGRAGAPSHRRRALSGAFFPQEGFDFIHRLQIPTGRLHFRAHALPVLLVSEIPPHVRRGFPDPLGRGGVFIYHHLCHPIIRSGNSDPRFLQISSIIPAQYSFTLFHISFPIPEQTAC